jgi:carboxymethylenebutenolidase
MIERDFEVKMKSGVADAAYFAPADGAKHPGILFLTDIRGIREAHRERARRLAASGYAVMIPNVFYRTRKPPMFDFPMVWGEPQTMQRFQELVTPLTADAIVEDGRYFIDALLAQPETRAGAIGIAGHCFTGAYGVRLAAAYPDLVHATASFHGGGLWSEKADSPHTVLHRNMGQMLFEHAENDNSMPTEAILKFESALQSSGVKFSSRTIHGAMHGWSVSDHKTYNAEKSEESFQAMLRLFQAAL